MTKAAASKRAKGAAKGKKYTSAEYISDDESSGDQEAGGKTMTANLTACWISDLMGVCVTGLF